MVGPVLKIKTGFRGFESEQNPGFESYRDMRKSFTRAYMSYIINRKFANLISKLNFYKLIPYPMDNIFTGRRDRSRQTPEKDVLYIIPAGPVRRVHSPGGTSYFLFLSRHRDVIASFSCLVLVKPLVS